MNKTSQITQSAFWVILICGFVSYPYGSWHDAGNPAERHNSSISNTDCDSLNIPKKYCSNITSLINASRKEGFEIRRLLKNSDFKIYEGINDRFTKSAERKPIDLETYKKIVGFKYKKKKIRSFVATYAKQLQKAEKNYGISQNIIAAILGIESDFGQNTGKFNPFNTYVSMYAVGYRQDFAKAQLQELLDFTRKNDIDVFKLKSSYAGAMSYAQFIPYSLNKWFVGDDIFDMNNNIMSVANYLSYFKKRTGSIKTAILRYNPSSLYRDTVLALAHEVEK